MNNVTAIIVSYNTRDLLRNCVESIRKFYPTLKIIIIDGSPPDSDCWQYVAGLEDDNTKVRLLEHNGGHGPGMVKGIELCETDYFLLCDSDVEIKQNRSIERMMHYFNTKSCDYGREIYGLGKVIQTDSLGNNTDYGIDYLHPHFALIKKDAYLKFDPIINHGAPLINAMLHICIAGGARVVNFPVENFIIHHERGTRALNPKEFNPANWDKI